MMPAHTAPESHSHEHETPRLRDKIIGLGAYALAGFAMHKGLNSELIGSPVDHLGHPMAEVAELAVIPSVLLLHAFRKEALQGVRSQVVDRIGPSERRTAILDKKIKQAELDARNITNTHTRVMDGKAVRYGKNAHIQPETSSDKLSRVINNIPRALSRKKSVLAYEDTPAYGTPSKKHERNTRKAVRARNKRTMAKYHGRDVEEWFFKSSTDVPRTRGQKEQYLKSIDKHAEAQHHVHHISENTKRRLIEKPEEKVTKLKERKAKVSSRIAAKRSRRSRT